MLYHFELQMAGVLLLTVMAVGGVYLWIKRRRERQEAEEWEDKRWEEAAEEKDD